MAEHVPREVRGHVGHVVRGQVRHTEVGGVLGEHAGKRTDNRTVNIVIKYSNKTAKLLSLFVPGDPAGQIISRVSQLVHGEVETPSWSDQLTGVPCSTII